MDTIIEIVYFLAAAVFIIGLKQMSSPVTARQGIVWAGIAMVIASLFTFGDPAVLHNTGNLGWMVLAIVAGSAIAYVTAKRVAMTDMPQMIAIYNGMGGGAAAAIAAVELVKVAGGAPAKETTVMVLAVLGAIIGAVSFSGSGIAFAKLQGLINKTLRLPFHMVINLALFVAALAIGGMMAFTGEVDPTMLLIFFVVTLVFGIMFTLPIGGADMPVVISLFNALTGLAVAFEGFVLQNAAMIIAGTVVGSSGTLLTQLMAKAMNRPLSNVLFSSFGSPTGGGEDEEVTGSMKEIQGNDAAIMMAYAQKVIIVPGYGMAVAQAQH
ncbi:MAG: NAD(P)(+) transhydrogenase (Re/Si-specific) subunit beta, partial [Gammaproteobacteria bacterium]|nr:NAD(P)(+) transhydrogenase (Re/Si-specific) subunit beta [Gammaproteobacteria bacterium]